MLLVSTTYLLLAQSPWSAGSMSGGTSTLVLSVPLSTAFRPFTLVAPPADLLIRLQPGPSGWQLTVGGEGSAPPRLKTGDGSACGGSAAAADAASCFAVAAFFAAAAAAAAEDDAARDAVDGVRNGPVSKEQPAEAQPVAAGPANVGAFVPRLDDVTVLVALAARADAVPPERTTSAAGSDNSDNSANNLRTRVGIEPTIAVVSRPQRRRPPRRRLFPRTRGRGAGHHPPAPEGRYGDFVVPVGCSSA